MMTEIWRKDKNGKSRVFLVKKITSWGKTNVVHLVTIDNFTYNSDRLQIA